ncbi:MAG: imidazoleglycerol-phosphate dehydratase HisB [Schwartzia sp.]|nr:imidazoleglycerol-phosphate dehydratase HisB [Schwartzia sp. (in: firmicutes)]
MRKAEKKRKTAETFVRVSVNLDGKGESKIDTGVGFFDHMLTLFAKHGAFDLTVKCDGDLAVDGHHSIEDIGIVLGEAFKEALGDKAGIARYGSFYVPMDEALAFAALDISGRPYLVYDGGEMAPVVGAYDTELTEEFLRAFAFNAGITLHAKILYGNNNKSTQEIEKIAEQNNERMEIEEKTYKIDYAEKFLNLKVGEEDEYKIDYSKYNVL